MNVLVTGAKGFIGRNLTASLRELRKDDKLWLIDIESTEDELVSAAKEVDFVFHLAGVNRPKNNREFTAGNADLTSRLVSLLTKKPPVVLCSSTQAALDNPYGQSKKAAEDAVFAYGRDTGARVCVYRLTNVFGKWSKPNYNSAVATFCHNIARDLPITLNDENAVVRLVYIDDVVSEFIGAMTGDETRQGEYCKALPEHEIRLGELAQLLNSFRAIRQGGDLPDQTDPLVRQLFATYQSFLPPNELSYSLNAHTDARGSFTELMHMGGHGQVSINIAKPGIKKGEHWHHTKHEKFIVVSGSGVIRLRKLTDATILSYKVSGEAPQVVDIPPGYTHNIENTGSIDLITVMWANERFDPDHPDTFSLPVEQGSI